MTFRPLCARTLAIDCVLSFSVCGEARAQTVLQAGEEGLLSLRCDARLGLFGARLHLWNAENGEEQFFSFSAKKDTLNASVCSVVIKPEMFPAEHGAIFFFEVELSTCSSDYVLRERESVSSDESVCAPFAYYGQRPPLSLPSALYEARASRGEPFVLTVQSGAFPTPSEHAGELVYQVFVDRFFRRGKDPFSFVPEYPERRGEEYPNTLHFGGDLFGVCEKLDYFKQLGVGALYLSPVFEAYSNHKYDTGDFEKIDERFGGDEAFECLLREAEKRSIRVILDGVFNHMGEHSEAFQSAKRDSASPFRDWFCVSDTGEYSYWWGQKNLPKLNTKSESLRAYFGGEEGIVRRLLRRGVSGFRLDVVDEYPDEFLAFLRASCRAEKPDSLFIGEVWEDASIKVSYGARRKYYAANLLDGVMNYPLRALLLRYLSEADAGAFLRGLEILLSHTPREAWDLSFSILSTHDTPRILNLLAGTDFSGMTNEEMAHFRLSKEAKEKAKEKLLLAFFLQFALPGSPTLYYGDEAGLEGGLDPFNRLPYPWGKEDEEILSFVRRLSGFYGKHKALQSGVFRGVFAQGGVVSFLRETKQETLLAVVNAGSCAEAWRVFGRAKCLFSVGGAGLSELPPHSAAIYSVSKRN